MYRDLGELAYLVKTQPAKMAKFLLEKYTEAGGSATKAANLLGCSAQTFFRWTAAVGVTKVDLTAARKRMTRTR